MTKPTISEIEAAMEEHGHANVSLSTDGERIEIRKSTEERVIHQFGDPPRWGIFHNTQKLHQGSFDDVRSAVSYAQKKGWAVTVDARPGKRPRSSNFEDVGSFHEKFGLPFFPMQGPGDLELDVLLFRIGFMIEELAEFCEATKMVTVANHLRLIITDMRAAHHRRSDGAVDLNQAVDALGDLNYVSLGTAHLMGLPFDAVWREIQRANMAKERASSAADPRSKRKHSLDVVKPTGWTPPNHESAIAAAFKAAEERKNEK